LYVVGGNITVLDNKSKKKKDLKEGDYLVVTPQVILNPREATVTKLGNSFSIKEVEDEEKEAHTKSIQSLKSKLDNTLFANYGQNIFGFKLK
jgi:ribosomal 50S subunit-recycling heat shock protein